MEALAAFTNEFLPMQPILRANKLTKSFLLQGQPQLILRDVDFEMREQSFVCVVEAAAVEAHFWSYWQGSPVPILEKFISEVKILQESGFRATCPRMISSFLAERCG